MDLSFIGQQLPPDVAQGVAEGRLHPTTHRPYSSDDGASLQVECHTECHSYSHSSPRSLTLDSDGAPGVEEDEEDLNVETAKGDASAAQQRPATSVAGATSDNSEQSRSMH